MPLTERAIGIKKPRSLAYISIDRRDARETGLIWREDYQDEGLNNPLLKMNVVKEKDGYSVE